MPLHRRDFLRSSVRAGVLAGTLGTAGPCPAATRAGDAPSLLPIIDTHQHLWDLEKLRPPWLDRAAPVLRRNYVTKDYREATQGLNIVKAVYMEIDVDPRQQLAEAEQVIEICKSGAHPTVAAVISGRPNSPDFRGNILRFKDNPYVKGVRQVLHGGQTLPGYCLQDAFVRSIQLLGEIGMSYDLCMRPGELSDGVKLVDRCSGTLFIVDHCGNADVKAFLAENERGGKPPAHDPQRWRDDMSALAGRKNTICKISGIVASVPRNWNAAMLAPIINHCLDEFGPDRVVFGGDWPVCLNGASYREWVMALKEIIRGRSESDQRKLLHDNAVRVYRLV